MKIIKMPGNETYENYYASYKDCDANNLSMFTNVEAFLNHSETVNDEHSETVNDE